MTKNRARAMASALADSRGKNYVVIKTGVSYAWKSEDSVKLEDNVIEVVRPALGILRR